MAKDLIIGVHSIAEALRNSKRTNLKLFAAEEGLDELKDRSKLSRKDIEAKAEIELVSSHKLQEIAKKLYAEYGHTYQRVPSHLLLEADAIEVLDITALYSALESGQPQKILCLDQVTDVHNAAAVLRTAAFFGVNFVVVSRKGHLNLPPSFFRIASGASEYVSIINVPSLPKALSKLKERGLILVGFSEHSENAASDLASDKNYCLILGAEDHGLSNAVERCVDEYVSLKSSGKIASLNVSVAAAIAMEKFWGA